MKIYFSKEVKASLLMKKVTSQGLTPKAYGQQILQRRSEAAGTLGSAIDPGGAEGKAPADICL